MYPVTTTQLSFATVLPTVISALIVVLIVIYLTRPSFRRLLGAVAGWVAFMVANVVWDIAGSSAGWWHYLLTNAPYAPPVVYLTQDAVYGIGSALIGWRIQPRFGLFGLLIFLLALSTLGSVRDVAYAAKAQLFTFGPRSRRHPGRLVSLGLPVSADATRHVGDFRTSSR